MEDSPRQFGAPLSASVWRMISALDTLSWDTRSTTDCPEYWVAEEKLEVERPLRHVLRVRLDAQIIDKIGALGRRKGLGVSI